MNPIRAVVRQVPRISGMRSYAAAAAAPKPNVKPPIALYGVDGTYASALYTAAAKTSSLESTERAIQSLKAILAKDQKTASVLGSPLLTPGEKSALIAEVSKSANQEKTVTNLLEVLAENNRLGMVNQVIEKFEALMGAHKGEVEATITSASPLDRKLRDRLQAAISKSQYIGPGKTLKIVEKVNPDVIGGLIVEVSDRTIDLSVSSRMAKLNKLLTDAL